MRVGEPLARELPGDWDTLNLSLTPRNEKEGKIASMSIKSIIKIRGSHHQVQPEIKYIS